MAMLFMDSFSHYATADILKKWSSTTGSPSIIHSGGLFGSNAMEISGSQNLTKNITMTGGTTRGILGFRFRIDVGGPLLFSIIDAGSTVHFGCQHDASGGGLIIYRGSAGGVDSTVIAASANGVITIGTWYYLECRFYIHPTLGEIELRLNGAPVINVTGVNTRGNPTFLSDDVIVGFQFRAVGGALWRAADLYFLDDQVTVTNPLVTFMGDSRIECRFVTGQGAHADFTPTGAPTNWQAVRDSADGLTGVPDYDTTYASSAAAGATDTYTFAPLSPHALDVVALQTLVLVEKTDASARTVATIVRHLGTDYQQASFSPSLGSYLYDIHTLGRDPLGTPWTLAHVNALEVGATVLT